MPFWLCPSSRAGSWVEMPAGISAANHELGARRWSDISAATPAHTPTTSSPANSSDARSEASESSVISNTRRDWRAGLSNDFLAELLRSLEFLNEGLQHEMRGRRLIRLTPIRRSRRITRINEYINV